MHTFIFVCLLFLTLQAYSQDELITGTITDQNGNPVQDGFVLLYFSTHSAYIRNGTIETRMIHREIFTNPDLY